VVRRDHTWLGDERTEQGQNLGAREVGVNSVFMGKADLGENPVTTPGAGDPDYTPGVGDQ
jgi:hypothetical protein